MLGLHIATKNNPNHMTTSKKNEDAITLKRATKFLKARKERVEIYLRDAKKPDPTARVALDQLALMEASGALEVVDEALIKKQRVTKKVSLQRKYSTLSNENLISLLIAKEFELEDETEESFRLEKINAFLLNQFDWSGKKYLTDLKRQKSGTNKSNAVNRLALEECMQILANRIQREVRSTDYPAFVTIVKKRYPKQPHVKATRIMKNEGLKTKEERKSASEENKRTEWTDGYMRKIFEEIGGVKPTTLKKFSSLTS